MWFTRLDINYLYNFIRIAAVDKWKIAFYSKQGLFEYSVMPFALTIALASFEEMVDKIFKDIPKYIWYLVDIVIHSCNTKAEHQAIVEKVLQKCIVYKLVVNLLKSKFNTHKTTF